MYFKPEHNQKIQALLLQRILDLLDALEIKYVNNGDVFTGPCPIHGGDNPTGWNLFLSGHTSVGNWKCWTHHCEKESGSPPNILGLITGVLKNRNNKHSFYDTLKWSCEFLKIKSTSDLDKIPTPERPKPSPFDILHQKTKTLTKKLSRDFVRSCLKIPPPQLLKIGLTTDILNQYDIGICEKDGRQMTNRIVCPVYDENYKYSVGCLGRTLKPKCNKCKYYHDGDCPKTDLYHYEKWTNSKGFTTGSFLYNYWFAKEEIRKTNTVVLVEGQWDVLKLVQNGIKNTVGLFGDDITDEQLIILERSGALNLVLLLDNDAAGKKSKTRINELCKNLYKIITPKYPKKDIGELNDEEINQYIVPEIRKIC